MSYEIVMYDVDSLATLMVSCVGYQTLLYSTHYLFLGFVCGCCDDVG